MSRIEEVDHGDAAKLEHTAAQREGRSVPAGGRAPAQAAWQGCQRNCANCEYRKPCEDGILVG